MQQSRSFHSQKIQRISPKKDDPQTPVRMTKKSTVQVSKNQQTTTASPIQNKKTIRSPPKYQKLQQKTIVSVQIRNKGLQKLAYLKHCRQKKLSVQQIFRNYPFVQQLKFKQERVRDENGKLIAQIVENEEGVHLVEDYGKSNTTKYVKRGEEEDENTFNGMSVSIFNNGNVFQGIYHNGHSCGLGYQLHSNGNTYIGNFKQGSKNGHGTYYWFANNEIYSGQWLSGLPHGQGIYIAKDRYEGNFANGLKHGFGEQNFVNGDVYVGEYVNSVADGYGEYYWKDGSIYKGDFKQGVRHGYGIWQDQNEQYKGNYKLDKKQGNGIYKWKSKQIYKGQFKDDYRQGYGQLYNISRENEKLIYSGCWQKGKKQPERVVDENKIKQLYIFLDRTQQLDLNINANSKNKKKQRVGHKHCIPNQFSPQSRHH